MSRFRFVSSSVVLAGLSLGQSHVAWAGWSGTMNGSGFGRASANVTSVTGVGASASITTAGPSAAIRPTPGYLAGAALPSGASATTTSLIAGLPGYIWRANTSATGGDKADNAVIEGMDLSITPQDLAQLFLTTGVVMDDSGNPALEIHGFATGGTALLVRGIVSPLDSDGNPVLPNDDQLADTNPEDFPMFFSLVGHGDSPNSDDALFDFEVPFPSDVDPKTLYITVDALATSTAPDSGSLGLAFACTLGGMMFVRRRLDRNSTQA